MNDNFYIPTFVIPIIMLAGVGLAWWYMAKLAYNEYATDNIDVVHTDSSVVDEGDSIDDVAINVSTIEAMDSEVAITTEDTKVASEPVTFIEFIQSVAAIAEIIGAIFAIGRVLRKFAKRFSHAG